MHKSVWTCDCCFADYDERDLVRLEIRSSPLVEGVAFSKKFADVEKTLDICVDCHNKFVLLLQKTFKTPKKAETKNN